MFFLKHDSGIGGVLDNIGNSIREAKQVAKEIGAKFEVKSCFVALKHNWDSSSYIPLDKKKP